MNSRRIDYIRITSIFELTSNSENNDVTFNIEYSADEDFNKKKEGIITLRLSEMIDETAFDTSNLEIIASQLIGEIFIRERDEEGTLNIFHDRGLPLEDWLLFNTPLLKQ